MGRTFVGFIRRKNIATNNITMSPSRYSVLERGLTRNAFDFIEVRLVEDNGTLVYKIPAALMKSAVVSDEVKNGESYKQISLFPVLEQLKATRIAR